MEKKLLTVDYVDIVDNYKSKIVDFVDIVYK